MSMTRSAIITLSGVLAIALAAAAAPQPPEVVDVYQSATCGCCSRWAEHLRQSGFSVRTTVLPDHEIPAFKVRHGVPPQVQSCHTAIVGDYVIEGHVPAIDIRRVLIEQPALHGLATPGMPRGAPGMEVWGAKPQPYSVMAFDKDGGTWIFARRGR
jgi:hypothetical protein